EHPHALAFGHLAVVELPKLWTLITRVPLMVGVAVRKNTLLRPAGFLVAARAPENAVVASRIQCLAQGQRLHNLRVDSTAVLDGIDTLLEAFRIGVDAEMESQALSFGIAKLDHFPELPFRIHVQHREGQRSRMERLASQVQQDAGIF